ncbi:MAG: PAS domain S-box protein [Syntrophales bacterium]
MEKRFMISEIFQHRSLKTNMTLFTLAIFFIGIWSLAFYASRMVHRDMQLILGHQQFSAVSFIAAEVNEELELRLEALRVVSKEVGHAAPVGTEALQKLLEQRPILQLLFNGGTFITGTDGTATASIPLSAERRGVNYMDRDYIAAALKEGKATIGRPVMGRALRAPVFVMAVPIRDGRGRVIGALSGVTNLGQPNFLDQITDSRYGETGGYLVVAPQHRLIITATDKRRIMEASPSPGAFPLIDRFLQGYEGTGILVNPRGAEVLQSSKGIPAAGWYVAAALPVEEAFAPMRSMQRQMVLAAIFLTLLAGGLTWWMLKRQLEPVFTTIKTLATLSDTSRPLPITRQDEIGELIGGFNGLLETLGQREGALKESEERYRTLFTRANEGIFLISTEGKLVDVNESLARMHGYSTQEMLRMSLKDFDTPETSQKAPERMRRLLAGEALTFEVEHYHKDGHVFPLEVSASLISSGGESYVQAFHRDITERKRTEEKIKESQDNYRVLFETASDGIFIYDRTGFVDCNEKGASMYGLRKEDLIGRSPVEFAPEKQPDGRLSADVAEGKMIAAFNGTPQHFEWQALRTDGVPLDVEITLNRLEIGGSYLLMAIVRSIAERKRVEQMERQNREETERLAEEIAIIAEIGRLVGSTLDIDEVYERLATESKKLILFDRLAVNLHGPHDENINVAYVFGEEFPGWRRGDVFPLKNSMCEVLTRTRTGLLNFPKSVETEQHCNDHHAPVHMGMKSLLRVPLIYRDEVIGSLHFGSRTANTYTETDLRLAERIGAQIAGALGSAKLFSEHKQAEAERKSLQERLQRAEKMEALGQLAGGVAHDLNNVLGVSTIYAELLQEKIPEQSPLRKYADNILSSTQKGAAIIEDLLTLARRGVSVSIVMRLNDIVSNFLAAPVFQQIQGYHPHVTFRTECQDDLLNIKGSPVHLEKTLMNLVSNAAEAISGRGEVTIRTENRYLDVPVRGYDEVKQGDYVVLTVSDTGTGITPENRERIFEPFYTKKTMGRNGTGLGLAIVWGTVKDHNGYIDLQTEVGKGTTFTLYFPVSRQELITQPQKVPIEHYMGKNEPVLVVDDIAEQREIAVSLLTRLGYQVHAVPSGEEAVDYLKEHKTDILVLDMIMTPGIDGLETYRRTLTVNPRQKAILVSGFSETDRVKEAQKLGAGAYVKKPYVMEKIGLAIREELDRG